MALIRSIMLNKNGQLVAVRLNGALVTGADGEQLSLYR